MTQIIAFAGRKQSGKTTCAEFVSNVYTGNLLGETKIYNFADPLKQEICMSILGLTYNQCYGSDESKNEKTKCYWPDTDQSMTAREVMQYVGTDIFRKLQKNVWADATINKIIQEKYNLALIADCRFPNEVKAIKDAGGIVIKLTRNIYNSDHASEIALDHDKYDHSNFDFVIDNKHIGIGEQNRLLYNFLSSKGILPL
jgi:hypothetical protein